MADTKPATNTKPAGTPGKKPKTEFTIGAFGTLSSLPAIAKRSGNPTTFNYEALDVGGFIPVKGRNAESLSSTISSANKRYREFGNSFEVDLPTGAVDPATGLPVSAKKRFAKRFEVYDKKELVKSNPELAGLDADVLIVRVANVEWTPPKPKPAKTDATNTQGGATA